MIATSYDFSNSPEGLIAKGVNATHPISTSYQPTSQGNEPKSTAFVKTEVAHLFNKNLSDGAFRLFLILKHYGWKTGECFPGQERLANDMGLKPRQIRNLLAEIEALEMVEKQARPGRSNLYALADTTPKIQSQPAELITSQSQASTTTNDPGKKLPPPRQKIAYEEDQLIRPINTVCESSPTIHIPDAELIEKNQTAQAEDISQNMGYVALIQAGVSSRRAERLVKLTIDRRGGNRVEADRYILKVVKAARATKHIKNLAGYLTRLIEDEVQPTHTQKQPARTGQHKPASTNSNPIDFSKYGPGGKYAWLTTSHQTLN